MSVSTNDDNPTTTLDVSWTAPDTTGIPAITGYDVQYRAGHSGTWTAHDFGSNGSAIETTVTGLDSNTTYQIQVRANNDEGEGEWAFGSGTTERTQLVVAFSSETFTVSEVGTSEITVNVTPAADRNVTVTITMTGTGATLSGLDANGELTIERRQSSAHFTISGDQDDDAMDDEVTLTLSTDADGVSLVSPFTVTVTIVDDEVPNTPPVITTTSPVSVDENQTAVTTLEATDPNDDPITGWSMTGGSDRALFNLANDGVLSFKSAPDYENPGDANSDNGYEIEVTASDGTDNSDPLTITVNVTNVNEPPGAPRGLSVSTNDDNPTTALDVSWTAPDTTGIPAITGYDVQYRAGHSGAWTAHDFGSNGSAIETTVTGLDSNTTYQVRVRATNDEGEGQWARGSDTTEKARLTITFRSQTYTVEEEEEATITVNVTPAADRNVTVTVTMTGTGATLSGLDANGELTIERRQSSAHFTISGDQDDDAMDDEVTLTLSTDADGVSLVSPFTITVTIVDDEVPNTPPVITTTSPVSVDENQAAVVTLEATDSNNDPITGWSITGGVDSALFNLTNDGVLSFKTAPDYENPSDAGGDNSLEVEVTASDGTDNSTPLTLTVTVTDLNEPPSVPIDLSVSTNDGNPTTALDVSWIAPDTAGIPAITGYDVQYWELGQSAWTDHSFTGTGTETTIGGLDAGTTYEVWVRAKNDEGDGGWSTPVNGATEPSEPTTSRRSSSSGGESNSAPRFDKGSVTLSVNENSAEGSRVGNPVVANDRNRNDRITYSLSGDDSALFRVDRNSGQITVAEELDFETKGTYFVTMIATDQGRLKDEIDITIEVRNLDEPGVITLSPVQSETNRTITANLTDPDGSVSEVIWQWQTSSGGAVWTDIERGVSPSYTPVSGDETKRLRAAAAYADGHGPDKTAESAATSPVLPSPDLDATVLAAITTEADTGDIVRSDPLSAENSVQVEVRTPVSGWITIITRSGEGRGGSSGLRSVRCNLRHLRSNSLSRDAHSGPVLHLDAGASRGPSHLQG